MGGTKGIAQMLAAELREHGYEVAEVPAHEAGKISVENFDAAIIGGALYANRWHRDARRFVERNIGALQKMPTWFFSSGPLDDSAEKRDIPPTTMVEVLMERVGALGHRTFGGRLAPDAKGFPASAMARKMSGDYRDREAIRRWSEELSRRIPDARPEEPVVHPGRAMWRLLAHGVVGWSVCAGIMFGLLQVMNSTGAVIVHDIAVPIVFGAVAWHYFGRRGARSPLVAATTFALLTVALDSAIVAGLVQQSFAIYASLVGFWLPVALIFLVTWAVGGLMSTLPWPEKAGPSREHPGRPHHRPA
jgi:menaquinone-dependent protoporphyrinogen oxidase